MPLNTPNAQDSPTYAGQAVVDKTDLAAIANVAQGYGVVSGCLVSAGGAYNVNVASGVILVAGVQVPVSAVTALAPAAASSTDRRDIVVASTAGAVSIVSGTPTTETAIPWTTTSSYNPPVKPAIPAGSVLLAEIYIPGGGGTIVTGWITDKTLTNPYLTNSGSQALIRSAAYQDVAERAGSTGAAAVTAGLLAAGARYGVIDVVIGDSIAKGDGGTLGSTDWASVIATTENRTNGFPDAGPGLVLPSNAIDGQYWNGVSPAATATGALSATAGYLGPSSSALGTSWKLAAVGNSVSDNRTFRRISVYYQVGYNLDNIVIATTGGTAPGLATTTTHSAATGAASAGAVISGYALVGAAPQLGDIVTVQAGTGTIPASTTIIALTATTITLSATPSVALSAATIAFNGYRFWDSGDTGTASCTAVTVTSATKTVGAGGGGVFVVGARYYQTAGSYGVTIDNLAIGGIPSSLCVLTAVPNGWTTWLSNLANQGTPARRLYVMVGLNDPAYNGTSAAAYQANITSVIAAAKLASPQTEVIVCAEYYGDQLITLTGATWTGTSGTVTITSASITTGIANNPIIGARIYGPGIPAASTVTVATVSAGSMTVTVTGVAITAQTAVVLYATQGRGGATNWANNWVTGAAAAAITGGAAFVNFYERFGDISCIGTAAGVATVSGSNTVTGPIYSGAIGQYVQGAGAVNGATITAITYGSSGSFTMSAPAYSTNASVQLYFTADQYGMAQLSAPSIHLGDSSQSFTGRDGQRAMAGTFLNKLAFSNQSQAPSSVQSAVATDGKISLAIANGGAGYTAISGFSNATDANPRWAVQSASAFTPPGLYLGPGGAAITDTNIYRANAGVLSVNYSLNITQVNTTVAANAGTVAVNVQNAKFVNSSAALMTITMATAGAYPMQEHVVAVYDFSAVAQTITWVNTEASTVTPPATSNGSTTLPKIVTFRYNDATAKWRCVASV